MSTISVREALRDAMAEEMQSDENVVLIGEEIAEYNGAYKVTEGLLDRFGPSRVIDTPITEHGFAGIAVGAAFAGLKPVVEFMTFNFAMQAIDQIINSAAKTSYMSGGQISCPIVFRGPNGSASRVGAQHSQCYASWYAHCPGLHVIAPYDAKDAKALLKAAIRNPNPVIFLEHEIAYGVTYEQGDDFEEEVQFGKALVRREGTDCTLVSYSYALKATLEAAEDLEKSHGIKCEVIDLRSIRPLDTECILKSVRKTNNIVSIEEGWAFCGVCAEISALVVEHAFDYLDSQPARVTGIDVPLPYAANLEHMALPNKDRIIAQVLKTLNV